MSNLSLELDLIAAKLDAKGRGKPCGKGYISARKRCSEKGKKQLTADLKAGDEGAKKRVARGRELAKGRQELSRQVQADKGKKAKDKVTPDWDKKLSELEDVSSASFKERVAGISDRIKRTGSEILSRYLNKKDIDELAIYAPTVSRDQVRVGDHLIMDEHVSDPRKHFRVVSQKGKATYGVLLDDAGQETSSKKIPIKFNDSSVTYRPKLVLDPESYFKKRAGTSRREFEALKKTIPVGVRRHIESEAYWEYAASQGSPNTSSMYGSKAQANDGRDAADYLKRPSVMDKKAYAEYEKRRKQIAQYKKAYLETGAAQAEFSTIHSEDRSKLPLKARERPTSVRGVSIDSLSLELDLLNSHA